MMSDSTAGDPAHPSRRFILILLAVVNFTHIIDSMIIMPLGDLFIEEFSLTSRQYSMLVSAYALAAFCSSIAGIFFLDRVDRRLALLLIYTGFGVGTLLCAFAGSYEMLLAIRCLTGLFGGMIGALVLSVVSDLYLFKERGQAMGILFTAFSAASALGVPIGIILAARSTWHLPFIVIGVLALLISGVIAWKFPSMRAHLDQQSTKIDPLAILTSIYSDRNQVNALIAGFVLVLAHFLIIPFISPYLIKNVGLSQEQIAYQFFFGGLATVFSSPIIGRATDRYGVMQVFTIVMVLSFIPTILITNLPPVPLWVAISCTTLFFVFASGRMISPNTIITAAASQANRGSFMSVKSALQQLAIAIAGILSGSIVYIGTDDTYHRYPIVGVLSILIALLTIPLLRRLKVASGN